jgi:hypothetical protein
MLSRSVSGTLDAWIDVSPFGSFAVPVGGGGGVTAAATTGPSAFEFALAEPDLFEATMIEIT